MNIEKLMREFSNRSLRMHEPEIDAFVRDVKAAGGTPVETMWLLTDKLQIGLNKAKELVLNSPSWRQQKEEFLEIEGMLLDIWMGDGEAS
jgi:hypothetical protein